MIITKTLNDLKERGYQLRFRREATCLYCFDLDWWVAPDSFMVDEYHRFEDIIPDGDRTIYAITTIDGAKGYLVDACFVYEDNISLEMLRKLESDPVLNEVI
ncbi:MAG: phosphoribosylpyrophosphate synthetase [Chitinophagaceae bacterium]|nr:phosphoribosylpyrophosphate synthetase [Chitinophagaceae bacterium]